MSTVSEIKSGIVIDDDAEVMVEIITENVIENVIGFERSGHFVFTQEESVEMLRTISSWCLDRARLIQREIDNDGDEGDES